VRFRRLLLAQQPPYPCAQVDEGLLVHHVLDAIVPVPVLRPPHAADVDDLLDPARPPRHHDHAIGKIHRFLDRVGDEEHRAGIDARQLDELLLHHGARLRVERAERLVHQQHGGIEDVAAGDRHALLHPAGKLVRERRFVALQVHELDVVGNPAGALALGDADAAQAEVDVLRHRLPREERELLEHDRAVRPGPGHRLAADAHHARAGKLETRRHPQAGRLAAAGRPDDGDEFLVADFEAHVVQRGKVAAVALEHAADAVEHDVAQAWPSRPQQDLGGGGVPRSRSANAAAPSARGLSSTHERSPNAPAWRAATVALRSAVEYV
jgi:hypothetical protein